MTVNTREHIRWMLTRDTDSPMQEISVDQSDTVIVAAFTVAIEKAIGQAPTPESVRQLVSSVRGTYVKSESLQPVQAEAVIRAAFGEKGLVEGISYPDMVRIQLSLTYGVIHSLTLSKVEFEAFLDEATELSNDLSSQGS